MPLIPSPFPATALKALTRSVLFSLGMNHVLIDFLAHAAAGVATVLLAILFVAIRVPRRSPRAIRRPHP